MTSIDVKAKKIELNDVTLRYVTKSMNYVERYIPRKAREGARANVFLNRVDRAHGNKYEATIQLSVDKKTYEATDSTLNVLAALDIVRLKLINELKKDTAQRLPRSRSRV